MNDEHTLLTDLANSIVIHLLILTLLLFHYIDSKRIGENTKKIEELYKIVQTVCPTEVDKIEETKK